MTLSEAMKSKGIYQVRYYLEGRFSVQLHNGNLGIGGTLTEAIERAEAGQHNVKKVAA